MTLKICSLIVLLFIKVEPFSLNYTNKCDSKAFIILFKLNSLELSSSRDTLVLDKMASIYKSDYKSKKWEYMVFESITCENELIINKDISKQRFEKIVAYCKKKHGLKKEIFRLETVDSPGIDVSFMNILIR